MKLIAAIFIAAFAGLAQPPAPKVTQKQLDRMVHFWQQKLRLQDWDIRAHLLPLDNLEDGTMGGSHYDRSTKTVRMEVLRPEDYAKAARKYGTVPKVGKEILADIEDTVVHELVHLRVRELADSDSDHLELNEEVTVNRLTSALLDAKHKR